MSAIALKLRNQAKFPVQVALHRLVWVVCAFIGAPVAIAARYGKAGLTAFQSVSYTHLTLPTICSV